MELPSMRDLPREAFACCFVDVFVVLGASSAHRGRRVEDWTGSFRYVGPFVDYRRER
jgi:hypothetical protein